MISMPNVIVKLDHKSHFIASSWFFGKHSEAESFFVLVCKELGIGCLGYPFPIRMIGFGFGWLAIAFPWSVVLLP